MKDEEVLRRDEIKTRLRKTQNDNEVLYAMIERTKKMIKRARLERSFLLERLDEFARQPRDDMDSSPPNSPEPHLDSVTEPKEKKDSKATKRPNAYTMFCEQEREALIKQLEQSGVHPKPAAVQSKLSERWKALSKEEKKPFSERAREFKLKNKADEDSDEDRMKDETEEPPESVLGSEATPMPESSETDALSEVGEQIPSSQPS